jgi:hypothetical protein
MECVISIRVSLYCDEIVPVVQPPFPEGGKVFEQFYFCCIGLHCFRTVLSCSFMPICSCSVVRLSWRVLSTAFYYSWMLVVISLSRQRDCRRSNSNPSKVLASLRMRSVGCLRGLDSSASCGQWLNYVRRRWTWAWAMNPLSVSLFITRVRCSIPICVALSRIG